MGTGYGEGRQQAFAHIRQRIGDSLRNPHALCMQHDHDQASRTVAACLISGRKLQNCMDEALSRLERGDCVDSVCDVAASPFIRHQDFPQTPAGGAASALVDAALLIVSVNPKPFVARQRGVAEADLDEYLNGTLHDWLLDLQRDWKRLGLNQIVVASVLDAPIPPPEREKATLSTMFRALCHSWRIGREHPSPYKNEAADVFSGIFRHKLWPHLRTSPQGPPQGCLLVPVSAAFQEWYFTVGRTQVDAPRVSDQKEAEQVFGELREQFHKRSRGCENAPEAGCGGRCLQEAINAVPDRPFKQACQSAIVHISRQLQKKP